METTVLIVGAGLSGTLLSHALTRRGVSHVVLDDADPRSGSRASSGILNPVMGRKRQPVPGLLYLLPAAETAYADLESRLGTRLLYSVTLTEHHTTAEEAAAFAARAEALPEFLHVPAAGALPWESRFFVPHGVGETTGAYLLDIPTLLQGWQRHLEATGAFRFAQVLPGSAVPTATGIAWEDINAQYLFYCNGTRILAEPAWKTLPLNANKGEALLVQPSGSLPRDRVFKLGSALSLVPLPGGDTWWAGASFEWQYADREPTAAFRERTEAQLRNWLRMPFETTASCAGERPTALDRHPIAGIHPLHPHLGIFNGLGTKGVMQAPYYAAQIAERIASGKPVDASADVARFKRVLAR